MTSLTLAACGGEESFNGSSGGADAANLPPIISGSPATTLAAGSSYSFTPVAADPNGDPLTFSATNVPSWATFNANTGSLTGTPTEANVGMTSMITIEVSDTKAVAQLPAFRIQVSSSASVPPPANVAPTIAGVPATTATEGVTYTFAPVADDANDDTLTFTIQNKPSWLTFTPANGRLSGTPSSANIGTTSNIVITVSDGEATASLAAFNLQVVAAPVTPPANRAPTITGSPATSVTAGNNYGFTPVGSDADGNTLRYSIQNQPAWASFNTTTGRLSGRPAAANVGTSARITISVTDGTATASLPSFTIQVMAAANQPPTISGTPLLSVSVLTAYSFQPSATDPEGATLTFTIANRPAWATFNTANGRLSGTPALLDIATFANIVISVSDGTSVVSLPSFSLSVLQAATGNTTVNWTAPTENVDGSALTDLASYRIVYGRAADTLDREVPVNNPGLTSYTVDNLATGTWFFAVIAVNSAGAESGMSNVATKMVN
ncbi:MAG TPA: putative Ig domain-containing protein [Steroidobacteraceae bacterium]|nr:putative Ig domain-containing protein [Steroidobacteraceae bacterium]